MSISIHTVNGLEGSVELIGLRAVVAMFSKYTLTRRPEEHLGQPTWTLRAALSYSKESFIHDKRFSQTIRLKLPPSDRMIELRPLDGVEATIVDNWYTLEGATIWREDSQP